MCKHHWIIETPSGETSIGHCKNCPATKEFQNTLGRVFDIRSHMKREDLTQYTEDLFRAKQELSGFGKRY